MRNLLLIFSMRKVLYISFLILFSSLLIGQSYYSKIKERLPTSGQQTSYSLVKQLNFKSKFDTILIITLLRDCGEFGGHFEYIKCFYKKDTIFGSFHQDPPECEFNFKPEKAIFNSYKKGNQPIDSTQLVQYFEYFKKQEENDLMSNAPTEFWIISQNVVYYQIRHLGRGDVYIAFRDKIFR